MPESPIDNTGEVERTVEIGGLSNAQPVGLAAGAVLGARYQIEATIGEGGSGQVFRAWDRALGEPIALKVLRPDRAREKSWIKRLAREVRVARAIRHPNVCRVFDLESADGHWFVSMELAAGGTLRDTLRAGKPRPLADRVVDARAICDGLAAIHLVGITHRDVTPKNVLRMTDGRLVLSDFGLAIEGADTTIEGGTPLYMPPETAMGQRPDRRADVWQLGAVLHELLFERRPMWDPGAKGICLRPPVGSGASAFEKELARLCRDCLAQNPADRPATAMEVSARLAAAEVAPAAGPLAWLLRRRGWVLAGALAGVIAAGAFVRSRGVRPPAAARALDLDAADRRWLQSLASALDAEGRHQDARRLLELATPSHDRR